MSSAARRVIEALEGRILLTALPSYAHASGNTTVTVVSGDYQIDVVDGGLTVDADFGASTFNNVDNSAWNGATLIVHPGAQANFNSAETLANLTINDGGEVDVERGGGKLLVLDALSVNGNATTGGILDLGDNDMIVHNGSIANVSATIVNAYNDGSLHDWKGKGIQSSAAGDPNTPSTTPKTALGFALNTQGPPDAQGKPSDMATPLTTFDGVSVTSTDVLVKYTLKGDATLDGQVAFDDFTQLSNHYGTTLTGVDTWPRGDFNYNQVVDYSDYALLSNNFGVSLSTATQFARTLSQPVVTESALQGEVFNGTVATFTDALAGTSASDYVAYVDWGYPQSGGTRLEPATVVANPGGGFQVINKSAEVLNDPSHLMVVLITYAPGSAYANRPAAISKPIQLVPQAITSLTATPAGGTEVDLSWSINVTDATGIEVTRIDPGSSTEVPVAGSPLPPDATGYRDATVTLNAAYTYRVRALPHASSAASATAAVTVTAPSLTGLSAQASAAGVNLSWTNAGGSGVIEVDRSIDGVNFALLNASVGATATTYSDTANLSAGVHYWYRVRRASGGAFSNVADATMAGLSASAVSPSSVSVSWPNPSPLAVVLERSTDGVNYPTQVYSGTGGSFTDASAEDNTQYWYRLRFTTGPAAITQVAEAWTPPIIANLLALGTGPNQITLYYRYNVAGARIFISRAPYGTQNFTTLPSMITPAIPAGLTSGAASRVDGSNIVQGGFTYQITAGVNSSVSADGFPRAPAATTAPATATNFTVTVGSPNQMLLAWTDASPGTTEVFYVQRADFDGTSYGPFNTIGTVEAATTAYTDTTAIAGGAYQYQVVAATADGSLTAAPASAAALSAPVPGLTAVAASTASSTAINISWTSDPSATGYAVAVSSDGVNFTPVTPTVVSSTGCTVDGLNPGTPYTFEVRAIETSATWFTNASGATDAASSSAPAAAATNSDPESLYVDPSGTDSSTRKFGPANPYRTIGGAVLKALAGDTILIHAGTYRETVTINSGGNATQPLVIKPFGDGPVTVSGTDPIAGAWTADPNNANIHTAQLDTSGIQNSAYLRNQNAGSVPVLGPITTTPTDLVTDATGQMMTPLRYPYTSFADANVSNPALLTIPDNANVKNTFANNKLTGASFSFPGNLSAWNGAMIHILPGNAEYADASSHYLKPSGPSEYYGQWVAETATVTAAYNSASNTTRFAFTTDANTGFNSTNANTLDSAFTVKRGDKFYLFNAAGAPATAMATTGGPTYTIDHYSTASDPASASANLYVHVWSATTPAGLQVAKRDTAFLLTGNASYVVIDGITLNAATIESDGPSNTIENVTAKYLTSFDRTGVKNVVYDSTTNTYEPVNGWYGLVRSGIVLRGSNDALLNSQIADCAGNGVSLFNTNQTVRGCTIHDCDYAATDNAPVVVQSSGDTIDQNTIYNGGRSLVRYTGSTNLKITYNDLYEGALQCDDAGGTYSTGGVSGTHIEHNFVHDIHGETTVGIYLDNGTTGATVSYNVVYNVSAAVRLNASGVAVADAITFNTLDASGTYFGSDHANLVSSATDQYSPSVFSSASPTALGFSTFGHNVLFGQVVSLCNAQQLTTNVSNATVNIRAATWAGLPGLGYTIPDYRPTASVGGAGAYVLGASPWLVGADPVIPSVQALTAVVTSSGVAISWSSASNDAVAYYILRGTSLDQEVLVANGSMSYNSSDTFTDSTTTAGVTYFYKVVLLNRDGARTGYELIVPQ